MEENDVSFLQKQPSRLRGTCSRVPPGQAETLKYFLDSCFRGKDSPLPVFGFASAGLSTGRGEVSDFIRVKCYGFPKSSLLGRPLIIKSRYPDCCSRRIGVSNPSFWPIKSTNRDGIFENTPMVGRGGDDAPIWEKATLPKVRSGNNLESQNPKRSGREAIP